MLADAVIAKREEAARIGQSQNPSQEFGGVDVKGLDPIKLSTLEEALTGRKIEPQFTILHQESDEGPWVFEISSELTMALQAGLSASKISEIATVWMKSEELQLDRWSADDAKYVIESLAALAVRAKAEGKIVMLWQCL